MTSIVNEAEALLNNLSGGSVVPAGFNGSASDFLSQIQPASFRGVPFAVVRAESRFGRSIALHEYPFKEKQWAEDMGAATNKFTIQGFIITNSLIYGGGDVIDQRERLVAAVRTKGPGTLIHPTYGQLQVSIPDDGLTIFEDLSASNYMEFALACYEPGEREFPSGFTDSGDDAQGAADDIDSAAASDFVDDVGGTVQFGTYVIDMAVNTATSWTGVLNGLGADATAIFNLAADLPGDFGRFFNGALAGFAQAFLGPQVPVTLENLIFRGTQARAAISVACDSLVKAADDQEPSGVPPAAQAAAAALAASVVNPADGVRLFTSLANFFPSAPTGTSVIGAAAATMQTAMGNLYRRTALAALVRVVDAYQPQSEDDANGVRLQVVDLLEAEMVVAGDTGDDASFQALQRARGVVASNLDTKGAMLPPMRVFTFLASLPSLVLAQRLYQDASRADQLVQEAAPPHPAFMPLSFTALSS